MVKQKAERSEYCLNSSKLQKEDSVKLPNRQLSTIDQMTEKFWSIGNGNRFSNESNPNLIVSYKRLENGKGKTIRTRKLLA